MSHSMYTHTESGNKAMITAWGPNWHYQVPYTIYIYIFYAMWLQSVYVCTCKVGLYSHICSSVRLHTWHAHYWDVASGSLMCYLLLTLESPAVWGLEWGQGLEIIPFLSFPTLQIWKQVTGCVASTPRMYVGFSHNYSLDTCTQTLTHKHWKTLCLP